MGGNTFKFDKVRIEGFRGRYFDLDIKQNQPNVFIMGNNIGKTTLIELLRWCFINNESGAKGKFSHMWDDYTHVLDFKKKGIQNCKITIIFSDGIHQYKFIREAIGEHILKKRTLDDGKISVEVGEDRIDEIKDLLDIDNGDDTIYGDDVHTRLNSLFRLSRCAEFFCFDGEKAQEIMRASNSQTTIKNLIQSVNLRASHPLMEKYQNDLDILKRKVINTAKKQAGGASENFIKGINKEIELCETEIKNNKIKKENFEIQKGVFLANVTQIDKEIRKIQTRQIEIASENSRERERLKNQALQKEKEIEYSRAEIFKDMKEWILQDLQNNVNKTKKHIREKGKLPEPYRESLIRDCLTSHPPTCQICNTALDAVSIEYVKNLQRLLASETSHKFLISTLNLDPSAFDVSEKRNNARSLIKDLKTIKEDFDSIQLSEEEQTLLDKMKALFDEKSYFEKEIGQIINELLATDEILEDYKKKLDELIQSLGIVAKYKIILEAIENTEKTLNNTKKKMENSTISIISKVISNSISSILGEQYSAILDKENGLMLADGGIAGKDTGGYASRLILSYCFAEAMSTIDPIIVDTPSGNIDEENRKNLAKHLMFNHNQLVLLCIPDEINNFADHITHDYILVKNEDYDYSKEVVE